MKIGDEFRTQSGNRIRVTALLSGGGESHTCKVQNLATGRTEVLKIFNDQMPKDQRRARTEFLVGRNLKGVCHSLCGPTDLLEVEGAIAHTSEFIEGERLEEFLATPGKPYPAHVKIALLLASAMDLLNRMELTHGDLHPGNLLVVKQGSRYLLFVIDFDNFHSPHAAPPRFAGHLLYMSPELRRSVSAGGAAVPDERSDRFPLAALLHNLLLVKHFTAGFDGDREGFEKAAQSGKWLHDPAEPESATNGTGLPSAILNPELCALFRKSFSLVPDERPTAAAWARALERAHREIHIHGKCGGAVFVDSSKSVCPYCGSKYPLLKLVTVGSGREIVVDSGAVPIGRNQLGSPKVSVRHAVCRRHGPETFLETFGRNPTCRRVNGQWVRIQDRTPCLIEGGDVLRFADVECRAEEIPA